MQRGGLPTCSNPKSLKEKVSFFDYIITKSKYYDLHTIHNLKVRSHRILSTPPVRNPVRLNKELEAYVSDIQSVGLAHMQYNFGFFLSD